MNRMASEPRPAKPAARTCPICGKPTEHAYRPFCSRRCADVDLNRWLSGVYAIPGRPDDEEDGAAGDGPDPRKER
jgi:uncharacterized protein